MLSHRHGGCPLLSTSKQQHLQVLFLMYLKNFLTLLIATVDFFLLILTPFINYLFP